MYSNGMTIYNSMSNFKWNFFYTEFLYKIEFFKQNFIFCIFIEMKQTSTFGSWTKYPHISLKLLTVTHIHRMCLLPSYLLFGKKWEQRKGASKNDKLKKIKGFFSVG